MICKKSLIIIISIATACGSLFAAPKNEPHNTKAYAMQAKKTKVPVFNDRLPIIIDSDMAQDDWLAIIYTLERPDSNVLAITVPDTGESGGPIGLRIAKGLCLLLGQGNIPVGYGTEKPFVGNNAFPAEWRKQIDTVHNIILPENNFPDYGNKGVQLLIDTIERYPGKVTILALGPLTNLAVALDKKPELAKKIREVVIMGGAVRVAGNVHESTPSIPNKTAEWNIFVDPVAADKVIKSGAPIYLIPLDACNKVPIDGSFYKIVDKYHPTSASAFVHRILKTRKDFMNEGAWYFWDPLAAALMFQPGLADNENLKIKVITEQGPDFGRTVEAKDGTLIKVAMNANKHEFVHNFMAILIHSYETVPAYPGRIKVAPDEYVDKPMYAEGEAPVNSANTGL
ncbi:nucleoside hydrolase [Lentisphaerota bacterium ZTH]|nr:nucleoside hydrolase [Lentisphaerota bacterium]WET05368.1 nucleoside hydrolase [Lentisphaerota bacterium ZTH]